MNNLLQWSISEKPRIIYSNGLCLVVVYSDNTFCDFIDIRETQFELDGMGFGLE